jgi:thiol-disulfide isomerase/thioredoxin
MKTVHLELIHEGEHCIPCVYMALVVAEVAPDYGNAVSWEKVIITQKKGALRFDELAQKLGRLPPVPSIFIDSELVFDTTPGPEILREVLDRMVQR